MGYVIVAVVLVLIVGGAILFLVRGATQKSNVSDARDPGSEQNPTAIVGSDSATPLGDTSEHSDADSGEAVDHRFDRADVARPVDGGEAEARRSA